MGVFDTTVKIDGELKVNCNVESENQHVLLQIHWFISIWSGFLPVPDS